MIGLHKLKDGHWPVFLTSMLSALTNLFLPAFLVRILTPEDIGVYKIFFLYAQSITFLSLAGGPLYSVYYWIGKKENNLLYLEHAWLLSFILSCLSALLGLIFSYQISHLISITETQTILLLFSAVTAAPGLFYGEYLIAKGDRIKGSLFNSGFEIIKAIIIVVIVLITRDINSAFWSYAILFLIKFFIVLILGRKEGILTYKFSRDKLQTIWKYAAPLSIAGALGFFLERIDMIILSSQLSTEGFAFYSMGCLIVPPLLLLEMSVQKVLVPALSNSFNDNDGNSMAYYYKKAQSDIGYLIIPAVFGLIIFSKPIIEILFTSQYNESATYLSIFALTYLTYIIPHDSIPRASGHTGWILKLYLFLSPLSLVFIYLAAGKYGAMGALIASVIFKFAPKIPGLIYSSQITKVKVRDLIAWKPLAFFTIVNSFLALICYRLKPYFIDEKAWFISLSPLYAIIYLSLVNGINHLKRPSELPI